MKGTIACIVTLSWVFLLGCAHGHTRGTVVFKDSEKEGHVCIGHKEARPGDLVNVFKTVCQTNPNGSVQGTGTRTSCEKKMIGQGRIVEFSGEHFAKIEAVGDLNLEQGLVVEKIAP